MTMRTIDCMDCGASVPYGRLSCPACGGLVASVAGAVPRSFDPAEPATSAEPAMPAGPVTSAEPAMPAGPAIRAEPATPAESVLAARPYERRLGDEGYPPARSSTPASAYRAPALALAATPAGGSPGDLATTASVATGERASQTGVVDPARLVEIAGWFVIVGSTMSLLGFLLPWSRVVIGAKGLGGYLDMWGLASPTHLLVFIAILIVLALGIVPSPVPAWIRSGVLGLAIGSLLVGLTWPYLVGPLGADVGVLIVTLGGSALVIGGVVASWATRHVTVEPLV